MKRKLQKILSNILLALATGSTAVFIAACYGVPSGFPNLRLWKLKIIDKEKKPVPNLNVAFIRSNSSYSVSYDTGSSEIFVG